MSGADDEQWMGLAVDLAWRCPPSETAYSVGAVIVAADGSEISRGFSRENDPLVHAEESALGKLAADGPRLAGATIYSTLEPCSRRKSRPRSCTQLIIAAGLRRVVIAWREPPLFVADCQGVELLTQAGITVDELPGFAEQAAAPNRHLALLFVRTDAGCLSSRELATFTSATRCDQDAPLCDMSHFRNRSGVILIYWPVDLWVFTAHGGTGWQFDDPVIKTTR